MLYMIHYPHPVSLLLPLHPFRFPIHHPHFIHIQSILLPPLIGHPWPRPPLHCQTQVHNCPGRNKLCDRVLATGDVGLHLLSSRLHHRVLQRGQTHTPSLPIQGCLQVSLWVTLWCNMPKPSQYRGSWTMFLTRTAWLTGPPQTRYVPGSGHPHFPWSAPL